MCNRYSVTNPSGLKARFKVKPRATDAEIPPRYNLAPTDSGPVVIEADGERILEPMVFGLIPSWAKDSKIALQCLNARSETITEKSAFKEAFKRRRCLVLADGFYEWVSEGKKKIPRRIVLKNREPFAFAGLWDSWKRPDGQEVKSFTIITTEANELLKPIHDRMPVILHEADENLWLAPYVTEEKTIRPLLKAFPSENLEVYTVSTFVNKSGNEGEECVRPVEPTQRTLF